MQKTVIRRNGLTLIELVVVLTILVALGGIAAATLPNMLNRTHVATVATSLPTIDASIRQNILINSGQMGDRFDGLVTTGLSGAPAAFVNGSGAYSTHSLAGNDVAALNGLGLTQLVPADDTVANATFEGSHSAQALAQIALAEQALGNYVEAELHMQQALAVQDMWINSRRAQLQAALGQISAQLSTIEIAGGVPGAEVYVNGVQRGTFPQAARIRARAGSAVVEIRAQGYVPVQRTVMVMAGGTARESIQLIAAGGGPGVQPQPQPGGAVEIPAALEEDEEA